MDEGKEGREVRDGRGEEGEGGKGWTRGREGKEEYRMLLGHSYSNNWSHLDQLSNEFH